MKKTAIALIVGFIGLAACQPKSTSEGESEEAAPTKTNLSFAYVNSDTLATQYKYFEEVSQKLEEKRAKYEKEFANRASGLQKQIEDYQKTAQNMTMAQARAVEEDLTRKQQNLQQYQQSLTQELLKEEAKLNKELYEAVAEYLKKYGKEHNLDMIFKHSTGGEIWYGDSTMDITNEVIEGLNKAYENNGEVISTSADSTATK